MYVEKFSSYWAALRDAGYIEVREDKRTGRVLMLRGRC